MRALVYEQFQGVLNIQNVADPDPMPNGVVVKVLATGLCRSDWHGWMGHDPDIKLPHVPGHELAGTVVAIGKDVKAIKIGDRVTVPFVAGCGHCGQCISGNHQVCDHQFQPGFTNWGSFAEYVALQNNQVVDAIKTATAGGAHVSLDALGSAATCFNSIACLRKRGKHIQVGLMTGDHQHPKVPMDRILADELEIIGSHGMQAFRYTEMLSMIRQGRLQPEKLIEKTISLEEATIALPAMNNFKNSGVLVIGKF